MHDAKLLLYFWNILINSTLTFFTLLLFYGCLSRLFAFSSRVKVVWSTLIFLHLLLHPFHYTWERWAEGNPWQAELETRQLTLLCGYLESDCLWGLFSWIPRTSLWMHHIDGSTFTPADALSYLLPSECIEGSVVIALSGSLFFLLRFASLLIDERAFYKKLKSNSIPLTGLTSSPFLEQLKRSHVSMLCSSNIKSPLAYARTIFIPESLLQQLTKEEFEAVLMHEWGHLRYKDGYVVMICQAISCLFWWVPTGLLLRDLLLWQEEACDDEVERFQGDPCDLASALCQTVRHSSQADLQLLTSSLTGNGVYRLFLQHRIQRLLNKPSHTASLGLCGILRCGLASALLLTVIFGRFWVF